MWLRVLTGTRTGKLVEIRGPSFVVGRDRSCNLVLRDAGVAKRHAAFRSERAGRWAVEDLGSGEGTFVATRRITRPVELEGTEEVCFGPVVVQLLETGPSPVQRRPGIVIAVAAAILVAIVGGVAGGLATQVGGGKSAATPLGPQFVPALRSADTGPRSATTGAAPEPGTTGTGATRHSVLHDDFSDPASGWEVFSQQGTAARYADGALQIDITDPAYYATSVSGRRYSRPIVSVSIENPGRSSFSAFGVVCRYLGEDDFYLLAAGTDGTAAILQRTGGQLQSLTAGWVHTDAVPVGASRYRLRAECLGRRLRLFVNDREVLAVSRAGGPGDIGLFAAGRVEFRFDDVDVSDVS